VSEKYMKEKIQSRPTYLQSASKLAELLAVHIVMFSLTSENWRDYAKNFAKNGSKHA
jgi:hypothetical protein